MSAPERARARGLVFDLDGTLIESRADLAAAVNRTRGELGLPALAEERVVAMVGEGARRLIERAFADAPGLDLDATVARFLAVYEPISTARTRPYPGIDRLLAAAAARTPLALLTNKPERVTRRILDAFGWIDRFRVVVGGDTLAVRKPDPGGLAEIAARLGFGVGELALVGDTAIDAATAAAAGCPFVFVAWGFAGPAERARLATGLWAADAGELSRRLAELAGRTRTGGGRARPGGSPASRPPG